MRATLGIVLATAIAIAAACAGGQKTWEVRQQKKNDLSILYSEIREWRREAGLDLEPNPQEVNQIRGKKSVHEVRAVCPANQAPVSAACTDVCMLADHICDNAESICAIAAELDGDSWAAEKCASAKASCREAKKKCCAKCSEAKSQ
jgi:hypothetical protein